jgi:hypothetical protein
MVSNPRPRLQIVYTVKLPQSFRRLGMLKQLTITGVSLSYKKLAAHAAAGPHLINP